MSNSLKEAIEAKKAKVAEVYSKVEEKGGTMPETRNLDNLTDAVDSIPSGGGNREDVEEKIVNLYDYDGIRIFSYEKDEFLALTELPTPNNTNKYLIFNSWLEPLDWMQDMVRQGVYPLHTIAMYDTEDDARIAVIKVKDGESVTFTNVGGYRGNTTTDTYEFDDGVKEVVKPVGYTTTYNRTFEKGGIYVLKVTTSLSTYTSSLSVSGNNLVDLYCGKLWWQFRNYKLRSTNLRNVTLPPIPNINSAYFYYQIVEAFTLRPKCFGVPINPSVAATSYASAGSMYCAERTFVSHNIQSSGSIGGSSYRPTASWNMRIFQGVFGTSRLDGFTPLGLEEIVFLPGSSIGTFFNNTGRVNKVTIPPTMTSVSMRYLGEAVQDVGTDVYCSVLNVGGCTLSAQGLGTINTSTNLRIHIKPDAYLVKDGVTYYGIEAYENATNWATYAGFYIEDL